MACIRNEILENRKKKLAAEHRPGRCISLP